MTHRAATVAVIIIEGYLYWRYRQLGAEFHFWLHGLFGGAIGVAAATAWALLRRRRPRPVWASGFAGHVYAAFPDVLLLSAGVLHHLWMDVFAFHIALHFIPAPLVTMLVVFGLTLLAWLLAAWDRPRVAAGALALGVAVSTVALLMASPLPTTVDQLRQQPQIALLCPVAGVEVASR